MIQLKVKDLIKQLLDFNPEAVIMDNINFSWGNSGEFDGERDIDNEKLTAEKVWLCNSNQENINSEYYVSDDRFRVEDYGANGSGIYDMKYDTDHIGLQSIASKMNELDYENTILKKDGDSFKYRKYDRYHYYVGTNKMQEHIFDEADSATYTTLRSVNTLLNDNQDLIDYLLRQLEYERRMHIKYKRQNIDKKLNEEIDSLDNGFDEYQIKVKETIHWALEHSTENPSNQLMLKTIAKMLGVEL